MPRVPRFLPAIVIVAIVAFAPAAVRACSCSNQLTLEEEFANAVGVFSGTVLAIDASYLSNRSFVTFRPIARWKGGLGDPMVVATPDSPVICGYPFVVGQDYVVFYSITYIGVTYTPVAFAHLCSRTSALADNPYVPQLPPPLLPTPVRNATWGSLKTHYR